MADDIFSGALRLLLGDSSEDPSLADPDDLPPQDVGLMTDPPVRTFLAFGEPVISYEQIGESFDDTDVVLRRRLVCPELDIASALAVLGDYCEYFTVIPYGYYGDLVQTVAAQSGVHLYSLSGEAGSHISDSTNLGGRKIYQRLLSAFNCSQFPYKWEKGIISDRVPCWVHTCLSSFVWSDNALASWTKFIESALNPKRTDPGDILVSLEIGISACEVEFSELWDFIKPHINKLYLLILSPEECLRLGDTLQIQGPKSSELDNYEPGWNLFVNQLKSRIGCRCIAVPFVSDDASCRLVVSLEKSAASSPRIVTSASGLVGKLIHKLMHAPTRIGSINLDSLVNGLTVSRSASDADDVDEIDRETIVREPIPEDSY
jgi:hypothetical protein